VQVTFDIPDDLASQLLAAGKDPARAALESLAVEGYRTERLSEGQVRKMLGYTPECRFMLSLRNTLSACITPPKTLRWMLKLRCFSVPCGLRNLFSPPSDRRRRHQSA
jgi:hypothetical protein